MSTPTQETKHYFVDEAGDGTLFDAKGRVIVGEQGCSNFFSLGLADVTQPLALASDLTQLRQELLRDPLLKSVRQMDPRRGQTAVFFHAKDDPVEVRREVFRVLLKHDIRFSAVVKCKWQVLAYVQGRNRFHPDYRYHPNELYDLMLRRLFKERLHVHSAYRVVFAVRGNRERSTEFRQALESARASFAQQHHIDSAAAVEVVPSRPANDAGLQAVDYFLWALQRVYERRDEHGGDRYLNALWEAGKVSLVVDIDDTRRAPYGAYYTKQKPLQAAALKAVEEYRIG